MAAEKNNKYWMARGKHGRDKIITDPAVLLESAQEYFQWCEDNPVLEHDPKVVGGVLIKENYKKHPRTFKKAELARFCGVCEWDVIEDLKRDSKDFIQVIAWIDGVVRDQKLTYATVGLFSATIVSRELGLKETVANEIEIKKPMTEDERDAMIDQLSQKLIDNKKTD